jgi:uncharacterized SAM-binding protein YcdF (DUF218 family)
MERAADRMALVLARALGAPLTLRHSFRRADAIVVLGSPLRPDGQIGAALDERVRAGVALWRLGAAPIVCVTGGGPPGRAEADAMAERALGLGLPAAALRIERASRNTAENARLTAVLLGTDRCRTVWLVSQPFHLRRAAFLFRKVGLEPLAWHVDDSLQYRWPRLGLRWIAREYAACARCAVIEVGLWARGRNSPP